MQMQRRQPDGRMSIFQNHSRPWYYVYAAIRVGDWLIVTSGGGVSLKTDRQTDGRTEGREVANDVRRGRA